MQLLAHGLHFLNQLRDRADIDDRPLRPRGRRGRDEEDQAIDTHRNPAMTCHLRFVVK